MSKPTTSTTSSNENKQEKTSLTTKDIQELMKQGKEKYRKLDWDKSKYPKEDGIELCSFRIEKEENILVVKVKGIFQAPITRCFADLKNDQFMAKQDTSIISLKKLEREIDNRILPNAPANMFTKEIIIRSMAGALTDNKDLQMVSWFWENDKLPDKKEILSQTLPYHEKKCFNKKKYVQIYDKFTQLKLESVPSSNNTKTEFLYLGAWHVPGSRPGEYERKVAEILRAKYVAMAKQYAQEEKKKN